MKTLFQTWIVLTLMVPVALGAQTQRMTTGDASLFYEDTGRGDPIVLIHGWMNDHRTWVSQVPALRERYRVIRYDRRGWGASTGTPDVAADPTDLIALLDSLDIERAIVMGHSQGADVALRFAVAFPSRVTALILYGVGPPEDFGLPWDGPDRVPDLTGLSPDSVAAVIFRHPLAWFPPGYTVHPEVQAMFEANLGREADPRTAGTGTPAPRMDQLRGITAPTLVIIGDHEMPYFRIVAEALTYGITGATKVEVTNAGHAAHLGQPDRFNGEILRFLGQVQRKTQGRP